MAAGDEVGSSLSVGKERNLTVDVADSVVRGVDAVS